MDIKINTNKYPYIASVFLVFSALVAVFCIRYFNARDAKSPAITVNNPPAGQKVLGVMVESARGAEAEAAAVRPSKILSHEADLNGISAKSFVVVDESTREVLFEKQPDLKLPIASLTKLMTVLLAYEELNPDRTIQIMPDDELAVEPSLNIKAGDEVKILHLMEATLVCSSNDAARALANEVYRESGKKKSFVALMNDKARELGLLNTNFSNPLGFDSDYNYSTVSDLEKLAFYTQNIGLFKSTSRKTQVNFASNQNRKFHCLATNKLIGKNLEIEAIKTGYTKKALGSIIAKVARDGKKVLVILIGSANREQDLLELSEAAYENYKWP